MAARDVAAGWARRHWFVLLLPLLLAIELAFARSVAWPQERFAEYAILIDLCLFVPVLYLLCYRRQLAPRALLVRTAALALLGVYIASKLVPPEAQTLTADLVWARHAGWLVLALLEIGIVILAVKLVFGGASTEEIAAKSGAPAWVARLMQIEARFWKTVWRLLRGR